MSWTTPHREVAFGRRVAAAGLAACLAGSPSAHAEGLWDTVLEKMDLKAAPAAPGPDFVERTRPDSTDLGYMPTALPHKVSPRPVKTPAEIEAQKAALDDARKRQLDPGAPMPLQVAKGKKAGKPGPGTAD